MTTQPRESFDESMMRIATSDTAEGEAYRAELAAGWADLEAFAASTAGEPYGGHPISGYDADRLADEGDQY